jgi:hypothetical protein
MPTPTYTPLATVTLGSSASSVTFSSIPATYRDLILIITGTTDSNSSFFLQYNSDTGSNYSYVQMNGNGSTASSFSGTSSGAEVGVVYGTVGNTITQIQDYSATDKHKTALSRSNTAANIVFASATRWANTAAITSVRAYYQTAANWQSGTTFNLFGVIA